LKYKTITHTVTITIVKRNKASGFTLIEVLLVIAILAILAAVVIVAINPAKQFGEAQDAERRSDVRAILDALHQYSIDNSGFYPDGVPTEVADSCLGGGVNICQPEVSCDGVRIDEIIAEGVYMTDMPQDPTSGTEDITGYRISRNANGRVTVCAPSAYGGAEITVTR
jgi:prepilin-type N-terminal cleavage/methylation domain-containing protein